MARARSYVYLCVTLAAVSTSFMVLVKYNGVSTYMPDSINVGGFRIEQNVQGDSRLRESLYMQTEKRLCEGFNTSESVCNVVQTNNTGLPRTVYPLQLVSGTPGSGNDWILWLGAVHGFETNQEALLKKCEVYHGYDTKWMKREDSPGRYYTHCLYVKTHEPFFERPPPKIGSLILTVDRAAVILRHPFDSALSEFKRLKVREALKAQMKGGKSLQNMNDSKSRTDGILLSHFLNEDFSVKNGSAWARYYPSFILRWERHARYWLQQYEKAIHIIIYKDFVSDTPNQLSDLMNFFGYIFDHTSLHRHCCVLEHPINKNIKRQPSAIEPYKEKLIEQDEGLKRQTTQAVQNIQNILDSRWPGIYVIKRG